MEGLSSGLLDSGQGYLHAQSDQAEGEQPGDPAAESVDLLRGVSYGLVRTLEDRVGVLGQYLRVDQTAQHVGRPLTDDRRDERSVRC